jgi:Protein of unknown function (DUF3300)
MTRFSQLIMIALLWCVPLGAMAQQPATTPTQPLLKPAELDQLLAPIALHPDPLLSEILIASSYPLEVVQADRWAKSNKALKGDALTAALEKQSWDDSVKALVQVPSVLAMMSEQLDWTQKLGDAVLAQQADVMDAVQRLRARARANGKLESTKQQTVTVKTENQKQYVVIEPTSPDEIYVPYYEPAVVYGDWPYPDYAPYYFPPPPGYFTGGVLATGVAFAAGVAVRHAFWGNCDWGRGNIKVVANRCVNIANVNRGRWQHNPDHRQGVSTTTPTCGRNSRRRTFRPGRRRGRSSAERTARRYLSPIAAALLQAIVSGLLPATAIALPPWIEIGRKLATTAVAETQAKVRLARQVRKPARRRTASQARRQASGRASRSATPLFQMSNQAPRLRLKPIVAAKASAVAGERLAWPRVVEEERLASMAQRPAWVAEDEAAVAGGPMLRLSTTLSCSADSTTALVSIASATTAASKFTSASSRRKCKRSCRRQSCATETATLGSSTTSSA